MLKRNNVVLVDNKDHVLGEMEKMEAHQKGILHRAFSVFIFDYEGKILLQQRAFEKYHGGGLWTNACCSHPQLGEDIRTGAMERLGYEMGLECDLQYLFSFTYKAKVENDLVEHELDHVLIGKTNELPNPHPNEVAAYKWIDVEDLKNDILVNQQQYTAWFKIALPEVLKQL